MLAVVDAAIEPILSLFPIALFIPVLAAVAVLQQDLERLQRITDVIELRQTAFQQAYEPLLELFMAAACVCSDCKNKGAGVMF